MAQRAEEGGVGGRGEGRGEGGGGALRRRRAASPRRPAAALCPRGGRLHLRPPPSPSQGGNTALDFAKQQKHTEVVKLLENAPAFAAQVGAAPPHLYAPPLRLSVVPCDRYLGPHPCGRSPTKPYLQ